MHRTSTLDGLLTLTKMEFEFKEHKDVSDREVLERAKELLVGTMENLFGKANVTEDAIKKDRELFKTDMPFRKWMAVCYRLNIKEIYLVHHQALN